MSETSELEPGGYVHKAVVTPTGIYAGMALVDPVSGNPYAVGGNGGALLDQASAAQTANGVSANLSVIGYRELLVAANVTAVAGTTPTLTFALDSLGADGVWYTLWTSVAVTAVGQTVAHLGVGAATNVAFGATVRLRWTIGGTTPSFTFSVSIIGK